MMKHKKPQEEVAEYYDSNTKSFLGNNKKRYTGAIHRKLYPPGVKSSYDAEIYINKLILDILKRINCKKILDLGCGVGGTIRYLRDIFPGSYSGITISPVQVDIAGDYKTDVELADFQDTLWFKNSGTYDAVYAVESLQHNPDHEKLCRNLRLISGKDSTLIVIDDFQIRPDRLSDKAEYFKKLYMKHWHACGFTDIDNFISVFEKNGFQLLEKHDLTGYMKRTPFQTFILGVVSRILLKMPVKSPAIDNIIGGNALKQLQRLGYSGYYKIVFKYI